ncbi:MAG: NFACT family protein, partial [Armatimonadota bacterium]|nr:NFACT family protein [Armatimonadota bacterium]
MTFDSVILAAIAAELNKTLVNGRVSAVHQPEPLDIVLTIRNSGANYSLLISAEAESPRIHLTSIRRPNPKTPPNFCMLLRKRLEGSHFIEAEQVDFDRILRLKFTAYDGERLTLIIEIMGKHSNIILVNDAARIIGAIKPIGRQKSRYREVLPGRQYVPPPPQNKINPLSITKEEFVRLFKDTFSSDANDQTEIANWLSKNFTGISPFAARELAMRSRGGDASRIADVFVDFFTQLKHSDFIPVIITDNAGHTIGFYPFPSVQHPAANQHERQTTNVVADIYYTSALPRIAFERAKENLISNLQKEIESRRHAIASIQKNIAECEDADRLKQIGDL